MTEVTKRFLGRIALAATLIVCCISCTNSVFVDARDITHGQVGNFAIGMSKQRILETARQEHVHAIRPLLKAITTYDYSNRELLASPGDGRSIELNVGRDSKVIYTIANCKVASVRAVGSVVSPSAISVGDSSQDLVVNLKKILGEDHTFSAREVVSSENESWFVIDQPQTKGAGSINAYDIWSFEVSAIKPAGTEFIVYFSEGSAVRISYKRARIRVE